MKICLIYSKTTITEYLQEIGGTQNVELQVRLHNLRRNKPSHFPLYANTAENICICINKCTCVSYRKENKKR